MGSDGIEPSNRKPPAVMIPSLNGIRALAFGLVFVSHAGLGHLVPGRFGVMVFFVLSGFLITTLLLREQEKTGGIALKNFYLRRILRLMPPLVVVLALIAAVHVSGLTQRAHDPMAYLAYLAYFGNYYIISTEFFEVPMGTGVLWSLAVEEHFYLIYPLLFISLIVPANRAQRIRLLVGLCALALIWRLVLVYVLGAKTLYLQSATDARFDALLFGCLLAVAWNPVDPRSWRPGYWPGLLIAAFCLLVLAASFFVEGRLLKEVIRPTVHGIALAPLFFLAVAHAQFGLYRWLNSRLLNYLGIISYSLYLTHEAFIGLMNEYLPAAHAVWLTPVLALLLSVGLSDLIRRWVEDPMAAVRRRLSAVPTATTHVAENAESEVVSNR